MRSVWAGQKTWKVDRRVQGLAESGVELLYHEISVAEREAGLVGGEKTKPL